MCVCVRACVRFTSKTVGRIKCDHNPHQRGRGGVCSQNANDGLLLSGASSAKVITYYAAPVSPLSVGALLQMNNSVLVKCTAGRKEMGLGGSLAPEGRRAPSCRVGEEGACACGD